MKLFKSIANMFSSEDEQTVERNLGRNEVVLVRKRERNIRNVISLRMKKRR